MLNRHPAHRFYTGTLPRRTMVPLLGCVLTMLWQGIAGSDAFGAQTDFDKVGRVSAGFLEVPTSLRLSALGGDQVAAFGEAPDSTSNPASLSLLSMPELWFSHQKSFQDTQYETLSLGLPMRRQAFGAHLRYVNEGSQPRLSWDESSNTATPEGSFRWSTLLANLSYGKRFTDRLSVGATLKGWREERARTSDTGLAVDAGFLVRSAFRSVDLGAAIRNLGPSSEGFALPRTIALGGAYRFPLRGSWASTLFSEWDAASHRKGIFRGGLEIRRRPLALRFGYDSGANAGDGGLAHLSMGAGLDVKNWHFDYAWVPNNELGDEQRFSVRVALGLTPEQREQKAREMDAAIEQRVKQKSLRYRTAAAQAIEKGQWVEARENLAQVIQWDPSDGEAVRLLKDVEDRLNRERAEKSFREGEAHFKRQQWLEAAYAWQRALQLYPEHQPASDGLSRVQKKLKSSPQVASKTTVWFNEGVSAYLNADYAEALRQWTRVSDENPQYPDISEYMEKARNKQLEEEVRHLKTQQKKDQGETEALNQQAYIFYRLGKVEKAVSLWKRVLALNPDDDDARRSLHEAQRKQELVTEGQSRRVVELDAQATQAYQSGRLDEAVKLWRKGLQEDPGNRWIQGNIKRAESELAAQGKSK